MNPRHLEEQGIQMCFCGPDCTALPVEPLAAHQSICLIWDWAAAHGRITPAALLEKIMGATEELGIREEELREEC